MVIGEIEKRQYVVRFYGKTLDCETGHLLGEERPLLRQP